MSARQGTNCLSFIYVDLLSSKWKEIRLLVFSHQHRHKFLSKPPTAFLTCIRNVRNKVLGKKNVALIGNRSRNHQVMCQLRQRLSYPAGRFVFTYHFKKRSLSLFSKICFVKQKLCYFLNSRITPKMFSKVIAVHRS